MGLVKTILDSVLWAFVFYLALVLLIGIHNFHVPEIAFTPIAFLTAIIFFFSLVANYRL